MIWLPICWLSGCVASGFVGGCCWARVWLVVVICFGGLLTLCGCVVHVMVDLVVWILVGVFVSGVAFVYCVGGFSSGLLVGLGFGGGVVGRFGFLVLGC